jgi:ribokinase
MGRVLVAGSINMDIVARAARFPRIGETVGGEGLAFFPGGKGANQAVAAARSGAPTALIGRLGDDASGRELQAFLSGQRVDLSHVKTTEQAHSGTAIITVCDGDNTIVVVPGANGLVEASDVAAPVMQAGDVLVSQLEIPTPAIAGFFRRGRAARARTILNPAPALASGRDLLALADIVVLNETEVGFFLAREIDADEPPEQVIALARGLQRMEDQIVCVTLGRRGVIALVDGDVIAIPGHAVTAVDTTGAGDCFVGALAARLADGAAIGAALEYANLAASICVQRMGAGPSMPTQDEVMAGLAAARPAN